MPRMMTTVPVDRRTKNHHTNGIKEAALERERKDGFNTKTQLLPLLLLGRSVGPCATEELFAEKGKMYA